MTHTPHSLAAEFPDKAEAIHDLKASDDHFAKLVEKYETVNRAIHRAETRVEPVSDTYEAQLRKQRMTLKDEIHHKLSVDS
jgi:uncharacterized protein YdcH (DUF465 family)